MAQRLEAAAAEPDIYERLARSIAPEVGDGWGV
jgi:DNA replicative helicase MCM subunit Mcm2 (Cdc46/Mcm family)